MSPAYEWQFWCDATEATGLGHLNRCLGYAEALTDLGRKCVMRGCYHERALGMISASGVDVIPEEAWSAAFATHENLGLPAARMLVDSYSLTAASLAQMHHDRGLERLLVMDDFGLLGRYDCDGLINFTIGASPDLYQGQEPGLDLFLGPAYYPARRWMRQLRDQLAQRRRASAIRKVLIVAGGTDLKCVTLALLQALHEVLPEAEPVVLRSAGLGPEVEEVLARFEHSRLIPLQPDLREWFQWADVCLCGGGLVKYECMYLGIPVASLAQTEGQQADSAIHAALGTLCDLGLAGSRSKEEIAMSLSRMLQGEAYRGQLIENGLSTVGASGDDKMSEVFAC